MAKAIETPVWTAVEIPLEATSNHRDPFWNVSVDCEFRGPGGRVVRRSAFWDGGNQWKLRFAPTAIGTWTWSTIGPAHDKGLHGRSGVVQAVPYRGENPFRRHGFLRVDRSGRHLCHADGTPFLWLGDTHWLWEQETLGGNGPDFVAMAQTRVRQGFNVYQVELFERWDGDQPNLALFRDNIDPKWKWLAEHGIAAACTHGLLTTRPDNRTAPREEAMARMLCARYGAYPSLWLMFQECTGHYTHWFENNGQRDRFRDVVRRVGRAYRKADAYAHPRTAHSDAPLKTHYRGEEWLDFTLLQGGHEPRIDRTGYYDLYFEPRKTPLPQIEGEANYELLHDGADPGRPAPTTDSQMREKAWQAMLTGCAGYTYGANGVWQAIAAPNQSELHKVYGRTPWEKGIRLPGANQLTHWKRFFAAIPWQRLVPSPECDGVCHGPSSTPASDRPVVAVDRDGRFLVAYLPAACGKGARLQRLGNGAWNASWFDPRTGERRPIGIVRPDRGNWPLPAPPTPNDWILQLVAVGKSRLAATTPQWHRLRVARDAERASIRDRNIAALANVDCSSNDNAPGVYAAGHAVDGNDDPGVWTHWSSDPARETPTSRNPAWLSLTWPNPVAIESLLLTFKADYEVEQYAIEMDGKRVALVDQNVETRREHHFEPPRTVRELRFVGMQGPAKQPNIIRLVEIEVLSPRKAAPGDRNHFKRKPTQRKS